MEGDVVEEGKNKDFKIDATRSVSYFSEEGGRLFKKSGFNVALVNGRKNLLFDPIQEATENVQYYLENFSNSNKFNKIFIEVILE